MWLLLLLLLILFCSLQAQLIKTYEDDIRALKNDVDNIEAIKQALPGGCWKKSNLEELRWADITSRTHRHITRFTI